MNNKGPEPISEVLSRLFLSRGWGGRQARLQLEEAWKNAAGELAFARTRLGPIRRNVLEVIVADAVLLQELSNFQKRALIKTINEQLGDGKVTDIWFRLGSIE